MVSRAAKATIAGRPGYVNRSYQHAEAMETCLSIFLAGHPRKLQASDTLFINPHQLKAYLTIKCTELITETTVWTDATAYHSDGSMT